MMADEGTPPPRRQHRRQRQRGDVREDAAVTWSASRSERARPSRHENLSHRDWQRGEQVEYRDSSNIWFFLCQVTKEDQGADSRPARHGRGVLPGGPGETIGCRGSIEK